MHFEQIKNIWVIFLCAIAMFAQAQVIDTTRTSLDGDSVFLKLNNIDSDTSRPLKDTVFSTKPTRKIKISKDAIEDRMFFVAKDSMVYEKGANKLKMYNQDSVVSKEATLTAGYIEFDLNANEALATGLKDTSGRLINYPGLIQEDNVVNATVLRYNFKSKKGYVEGARTQQGDLYIVGNRSKYIQETNGNDTISKNVIFQRNAILTTCDAGHPHFGIRSSRQKLITDEWAILGPSYVELGGIPTPLVLPFAAVPLKQGRRSGLILPQDYEYSPELGFGFRNIGYYFPINDYVDLILTTDVYLRGTYGIRANSRYKKRYKYSGNANLSFNSYAREVIVPISENVNELQTIRNNEYSIQWSHNQDAKAHPYRSFSTSVNVASREAFNFGYNTADRVLQNSLRSTINFNQRFANKPGWLLSVSAQHSQNLANGDFRVELPNVRFNMGQFKPFEKAERVGKEKWYERINMSYSANAIARVNTKDSLLFTQEFYDDIQYGVQHRTSMDMNFRVLKYFNLTPRINYQEDWLFETYREELDDIRFEFDTTYIEGDSVIGEITIDTISNVVNSSDIDQFAALRTFDVGVNLTTQIFGTLLFKKGWLRGLRHTIKPNFSLSYTPNYATDFWNYYRERESDRIPSKSETVEYSKFNQTVFGTRVPNRNRLNLNYGFQNIFEAKIFSKRDSSSKNINLLRNLNINGSYDFLADSLNFSDVNYGCNFQLIKNFTRLTVRGRMSYYAQNEQGRVIDRFYFDETNKLLRFVNLNVSLNTTFTVQKLRTAIEQLISGKESEEKPEVDRNNQSQKGSSLWSLIDGVNIRHDFQMQWDKDLGETDFAVARHQINLSGAIPLSEKWRISVGNIGYDFQSKSVTFPDLGFTRDLHCWELDLRWQPQRGTYMFSIYAKPGSMDFLNVPYRRNQFDQTNPAF